MARKRRTRQHAIADLAINYVERQALLSGFTVDRSISDYGIDLYLATYDADGYVETGQALVQVKATDALRVLVRRPFASIRVTRSDLDRWLDEPMPVILVIYDGRADVAYWLDVQAYFRVQGGFDLARTERTVAVRIDLGNRLDPAAMKEIARIRNEAKQRAREGHGHHG